MKGNASPRALILLRLWPMIQAGSLARLLVCFSKLPVICVDPAVGTTPTKIKGWPGNLLVLETVIWCVGGADDPKG
ncbi:MAG: hypothetical protein SNJ84_06785 [Verrucomicrobiia bacterium]